MKLNLLQKHGNLRLPLRYGPLFGEVMARHGCRTDGEINVVLTGDGQIRRLNRDYLGRDRETDVIAFNLDPEDDPLPGGVFGEVYVSLDQARRQAAAEGHSFTREVLILVLHGLFHLFGEDDGTPVERRRMESRVEAALATLEAAVAESRGN
jgi:probable rRNA maturation factor